jgi:hypothetical protein
MDSKVKLINQNMFTWTSTRGWNYLAAHKSGFFFKKNLRDYFNYISIIFRLID